MIGEAAHNGVEGVFKTAIQIAKSHVGAGSGKMGVGRQLVAASEAFARRNGYDVMELNARDTAVPFYEKLDYTVVGEQFEEVGIVHFKMMKNMM